MPGKFLEYIKAGQHAIPVEITFLPTVYYDDSKEKEVNTSKWVEKQHWKEIKIMLKPAVECVLKYNDEPFIEKATKTEYVKHGQEISLGYIIAINKDKSPFLSVLDLKTNCWTDDEDESNYESESVLDLGGLYKALQPTKLYLKVVVILKSDSYTEDAKRIRRELGLKSDDLRNFFSTVGLDQPGTSKPKASNQHQQHQDQYHFIQQRQRHHFHHLHHNHNKRSKSDHHFEEERSMSPVIYQSGTAGGVNRNNNNNNTYRYGASCSSSIGHSETTDTIEENTCDSAQQPTEGVQQDQMNSRQPQMFDDSTDYNIQGDYYEEADNVDEQGEIDSLLIDSDDNRDPFEHRQYHRSEMNFGFHDNFHIDADAEGTDDDDDDFSLPDIDTPTPTPLPVTPITTTKKGKAKKRVLEPTSTLNKSRRKSSEHNFSSDGGGKTKRKRSKDSAKGRKKKDKSPSRPLSFEEALLGKRSNAKSPTSRHSAYSESLSLQKTIENVSKEAEALMKEKAQMRKEKEALESERVLNEENSKKGGTDSGSNRGAIGQYNKELVERLLNSKSHLDPAKEEREKRQNSPQRNKRSQSQTYQEMLQRDRMIEEELRKRNIHIGHLSDNRDAYGGKLKKKRKSITKTKPLTVAKPRKKFTTNETGAKRKRSSIMNKRLKSPSKSDPYHPYGSSGVGSAIIIKHGNISSNLTSTSSSSNNSEKSTKDDKDDSSRDPEMPILMPMIQKAKPDIYASLLASSATSATTSTLGSTDTAATAATTEQTGSKEIPVLEPTRTLLKTKAATKQFPPNFQQLMNKSGLDSLKNKEKLTKDGHFSKSKGSCISLTEKVTPCGNHYMVQVNPRERQASIEQLNQTSIVSKTVVEIVKNPAESDKSAADKSTKEKEPIVPASAVPVPVPAAKQPGVDEEVQVVPPKTKTTRKKRKKVASTETVGTKTIEQPAQVQVQVQVPPPSKSREIAIQTDAEEMLSPEIQSIVVKIEKLISEDSKENLRKQLQEHDQEQNKMVVGESQTDQDDDVVEIDPFSFERIDSLPNINIIKSSPNITTTINTSIRVGSGSPVFIRPSSPVPGPSSAFGGPQQSSSLMMPPPRRPPQRTPKKSFPNPQFNPSVSSATSTGTGTSHNMYVSSCLPSTSSNPSQMSVFQILSNPNTLSAGMNILSRMTQANEIREIGKRLGVVEAETRRTSNRPASPDITYFGKRIKEEKLGSSSDEDDDENNKEGTGKYNLRMGRKIDQNQVDKSSSSQQQLVLASAVHSEEDDLGNETEVEEGEKLIKELMTRMGDNRTDYQPRGDEFDLSQRSVCFTNIVPDYANKSRLFKMHSKKIKDLTFDDLVEHFNAVRSEVRGVFEGRVPSIRQSVFNLGPKHKKELTELTLSVPFNNHQASHIIAFLYDYLIPDRSKRMQTAEYISLVALSETFMRIYARVCEISIHLAETEMRYGACYEQTVETNVMDHLK